MKKHNQYWIVWNRANSSFMSHPRGVWTFNLNEAYLWHYKKEAQDDGRGLSYRVTRLGEAKKILGLQ